MYSRAAQFFSGQDRIEELKRIRRGGGRRDKVDKRRREEEGSK